jgi:NosR/NirI family nitrous oxide reductase transcriptional regulator
MVLDQPETKSGSLALWTTMTWALVLVVIAGCLVFGFLDIIAPPQPLPEKLILAVFPDASRTEKSNDPFFHYKAHDTGGRLIGAIVVTDTVSPAVKGYLGEIGVAVGITTEGSITRAVPVRHMETPYYMDMIVDSGLIDEMTGLDLSRPFPEFDTISGATISSHAIIRDIREASSRASRSLFGIVVPPPAASMKNPWMGWKTGLLAALLGMSLLAGFSRERKWFRFTLMLLNLAGIGVILNTPLTLSALSRVLTLNLPGPENTLLILIFLYILISLPLQGRDYCRMVCPFGTLQDLADHVSPWKLKFAPGTLAFLPGIRRLILAILLLLSVWIGWDGFTEVEPFFSLFSFKLTSILWFMVIFLLLISVFVRRFWCNTMCPTGTLLSIVSRLVRPGSGKADETV